MSNSPLKLCSSEGVVPILDTLSNVPIAAQPVEFSSPGGVDYSLSVYVSTVTGDPMVLKNKLNITSQVELNRAEEKISKQKAKQLFETGVLDTFSVGSFVGLAHIHHYLFDDIYDFAGKVRDVNIAKGNFRFVPPKSD